MSHFEADALPESPRASVAAGHGNARRPLFRTANAEEALLYFRPAQSRNIDHMIEQEIIPRLLVAHSVYGSQGRQARAATLPRALIGDEVPELIGALLRHDQAAALAHVRQLMDAGYGLDEVYLDLLTPAARQLGVMWETDEADFVQVTLGLSMLQQMVRDLASGEEERMRIVPSGHSVLLATAAGEQHTFGIMLVEEFFRREGWSVSLSVMDSSETLVRTVESQFFDVIGLSVSRSLLIDTTKADIQTIRRVSKNPNVKIMVGGRCFLEDPELVVKCGADGMSGDARDATGLALALVEQQTHA